MRIGIPREIKPKEGRVALTPAAVAEIAKHGHKISVQADAGVAAGYPDLDYRQAGARIVPDAATLYGAAELILKVKEPMPAEYGLLREEHLLFCFLHLAANPELAGVLRDRGLTAVAFETVQTEGRLAVLAPMSRIAGRLAVQIGATLLQAHAGGRGVLLGGLPGVERGHVVVLGAGVAGGDATALAATLGARVSVFDRKADALERMHALAPNVTASPAHTQLIEEAVGTADLLIGAVLIPGARAPRLVTAQTVSQMRPGSVIVDTSVDQGGCVETIRPTDYAQPTYLLDDVVHFGVANMPGAVPRTATQVLSAVLLPYVLRIAGKGGLSDPTLKAAINVADGKFVHPVIAAALAHAH